MGEIKQLGTIICSLFFQFTHDLKKQISTISYYPYEKFLVKVGTIREGGKRVVSMYFVILCPEANKTPPEMVNPTLPRTSQGVATGFLLQSSMAIQLEWQKNTERHTAGCNLCKGAQDRVTVSYNKEYAGNGRKYKLRPIGARHANDCHQQIHASHSIKSPLPSMELSMDFIILQQCLVNKVQVFCRSMPFYCT